MCPFSLPSVWALVVSCLSYEAWLFYRSQKLSKQILCWMSKFSCMFLVVLFWWIFIYLPSVNLHNFVLWLTNSYPANTPRPFQKSNVLSNQVICLMFVREDTLFYFYLTEWSEWQNSKVKIKVESIFLTLAEDKL